MTKDIRQSAEKGSKASIASLVCCQSGGMVAKTLLKLLIVMIALKLLWMEVLPLVENLLFH